MKKNVLLFYSNMKYSFYLREMVSSALICVFRLTHLSGSQWFDKPAIRSAEYDLHHKNSEGRKTRMRTMENLTSFYCLAVPPGWGNEFRGLKYLLLKIHKATGTLKTHFTY